MASNYTQRGLTTQFKRREGMRSKKTNVEIPNYLFNTMSITQRHKGKNERHLNLDRISLKFFRDAQ